MEGQKREEFKVVIYRNGEKVKEETVNTCFLVTENSRLFFAQGKTFDVLDLLTNVSERLDEAIEEISKEMEISPLELLTTIEAAKRFKANA